MIPGTIQQIKSLFYAGRH